MGNLIWVLLEIYCSLQQWKNFANQSRIDKVIAMVRVAHFFDSRCIILYKPNKPSGFSHCWLGDIKWHPACKHLVLTILTWNENRLVNLLSRVFTSLLMYAVIQNKFICTMCLNVQSEVQALRSRTKYKVTSMYWRIFTFPRYHSVHQWNLHQAKEIISSLTILNRQIKQILNKLTYLLISIHYPSFN